MKLTREDLLMMLDEMNNCGADCMIIVDVDARGYDYEIRGIDFDLYSKSKGFIKTVLTNG